MRGQNSADDNSNGGVDNSTSSVSKCPIHTHKLPAKFKDTDTLTGSGSVQALKVRNNAAITDKEDQGLLQKKKPKTRLFQGEPDPDIDHTSLDEGPNKKNTCVFPQASEDAQETCVNTDVSSNWGDSGNASTEDANTMDVKGCGTDEEEWGFLQLDKMATKNTQALKPARTHSSTGVSIRIVDLIAIFMDAMKNLKTLGIGVLTKGSTWWDANTNRSSQTSVMSAVTAMTNTGEGIKEQGTLKGWNTANAKVPLWSKEGLMEHIVELVVVDDQPSNTCSCSNAPL
ncbi:hypothetical protein V8E53_002614 [Lactarius tabidus]